MNIFNGKRTYLVAIGGILTALGATFEGSMQVTECISLCVTSLLAIFLRKGVKAGPDPIVK
jgi:hypothetical protein